MSENELKSTQKKNNRIKIVAIQSVIVFFLIVVSPIIVVPFIGKDIFLRLKFLKAVRTQNKFILFVYSNSPIWKSYINNNILPKIKEHALILNWSERSQWDKKEWMVQAFEHWGGREDFNPLAIVFSKLTKVRIIRFYRPFLDFKHGNEIPLQKVEAELYNFVDY